jgi:ubiquinone biosynthesis protein COQ9
MAEKNKNFHWYVDAKKFDVNHYNKALLLYGVYFSSTP